MDVRDFQLRFCRFRHIREERDEVLVLVLCLRQRRRATAPSRGRQPVNANAASLTKAYAKLRKTSAVFTERVTGFLRPARQNGSIHFRVDIP